LSLDALPIVENTIYHPFTGGDDQAVNEGRKMEANDPLTCGSEQERELIEFEKQLRDSKTKKSEGPKLFQQLQEHLLKELRDANRRKGKKEYSVEYLRSSPLDLIRHMVIRVQRRDKKTPPLTITYSPFTDHTLHLECGARKCDYALVAGEDGVHWFDISAQIRKTIQEVATEMLKGIETDNLADIQSATEHPGLVRSWLHSKRTAEGRR
jgi:hypothetical protein